MNRVFWKEREINLLQHSLCWFLYDCRVKNMKAVASSSLLALWLPCVTHGSSMLHSLLLSVCLFVSLLIPSLSQPHSLSSSCLPRSFPQAWILPPASLSCSYFPTWCLVCTFAFPFFITEQPPLTPHLMLLLSCLISFYIFMNSTHSCICWSEAVSFYHLAVRQLQMQRRSLLF